MKSKTKTNNDRGKTTRAPLTGGVAEREDEPEDVLGLGQVAVREAAGLPRLVPVERLALDAREEALALQVEVVVGARTGGGGRGLCGRGRGEMRRVFGRGRGRGSVGPRTCAATQKATARRGRPLGIEESLLLRCLSLG